MTEWYDDTDPPNDLVLDPEDLGMAWSDISPGHTRVRFTTPNFVKRGLVTKLKGRSMRILVDGDVKETVMPDAKWYWIQAKMGNRQENMVAISTPPPAKLAVTLPTMSGNEALGPVEVAAMLGTDAKNVRRWIRSGKLPATRVGGRWVVRRSDAEKMR